MAAGWISKKSRKALYNRDNLICCYCGKTCVEYSEEAWKNTPHDVATLDHIVSQKDLAAAAQDDAHFAQLQKDPTNLVVVCNGCNSSKKHTPLYVWCVKSGKEYANIIAEISRRINS